MKKILDILAFLFILANVIISCAYYFSGEIVIPAHFHSLEQMKTYGQTWMILVLAGISLVIYILMVVSERHHLVSLPFKVKNVLSAQPFIEMMLAWSNMLLMLALLYVDLVVTHQEVPFSIIIIYALIALVCIVCIYYTRKIYLCGRGK